MFKNFFFLGLITAFASTFLCVAYTEMYYSLIVDFSEANGILLLFAYSLLASMVACLVAFAIQKAIKNQKFAEVLFNLLFAGASVVGVFVVLAAKDPDFQTENAQLFAEFYKGFLMPMLFFPFLTWFTLKPLIIRS